MKWATEAAIILITMANMFHWETIDPKEEEKKDKLQLKFATEAAIILIIMANLFHWETIDSKEEDKR